MEKLKFTGGAKIGGSGVTWPFATLSVDKEELELNASIAGFLVFQPKDIIAIEPHTVIPFLGQGIKITHRIPVYDSKVIFWSFKDPEAIINHIKEVGFWVEGSRSAS